MKNLGKKVLIPIIVILLVASLVVGAILFCAHIKEQEVVMRSAAETYTVNVNRDNANIIIKKDVATIEKYNGNADTVVIDKDALDTNKLNIEDGAFAECKNLDTILIDKDLVSDGLEIENFEINTEYEDEQYVEYKTTKEYSKAYQYYLELSEEEKAKIEAIPSKYDVSISALYTQSMEENYNVSEIQEETIPENFDLREVINIDVENQGMTGTCYAYASLSSVETNLALTKNEYIDLSEVHAAALTTGYGGWFTEATNLYYADKVGPVYESEWPIEDLWTSEEDYIIDIYNYLCGYGNPLSDSTEELLKETPAKKYVTETVNLPAIYKYDSIETDNIGEEETRKVIKKHIMEYGSLYAGINANIVEGNYGYYVLNQSEYAWDAPHAVSVIGWDDNFSRENFPKSCRPEKDGAYLALNSWGEEWGNDGYFWISYEDNWIETELSGVICVEDITENVSINSFEITDIETNSKIVNGKITKGSNIEVEVNVSVNEMSSNQNQFGISILSPSGEDIINKIEISGQNIENNEALISFNLNTRLLEIGVYTVNISYGEETISRIIKINPNTFDYAINSDNSITLIGYYGDDKNLIIPEEFLGYQVTGIGNNAFYANELYSITIYNHIREIGEFIVNESTIIYGNSGTLVEEYATQNGYKFIDLNEDTIEGTGWYYNTSNHKLYISENSENMSYEYLKKLIYIVEMADGIEEILPGQFCDYDSLNTVILPSTITNISYGAFEDCDSLQAINIPEKVTNIQNNTFAFCRSLTNIEIPENVITIGSFAFYKCKNLKNVTLPESVTDISSYAFYNCRSLQNINISPLLNNIEAFAFSGCVSLTDVKFLECSSSQDIFRRFRRSNRRSRANKYHRRLCL